MAQTREYALKNKDLSCFHAKLLHVIKFQAFLSALVEADNSENFSTVLKDARKVLVSVEGEHGNRIVIDDLLLGIKNQDPQMRYISLVLLHAFCKVVSPNTQSRFFARFLSQQFFCSIYGGFIM